MLVVYLLSLLKMQCCNILKAQVGRWTGHYNILLIFSGFQFIQSCKKYYFLFDLSEKCIPMPVVTLDFLCVTLEANVSRCIPCVPRNTRIILRIKTHKQKDIHCRAQNMIASRFPSFLGPLESTQYPQLIFHLVPMALRILQSGEKYLQDE